MYSSLQSRDNKLQGWRRRPNLHLNRPIEVYNYFLRKHAILLICFFVCWDFVPSVTAGFQHGRSAPRSVAARRMSGFSAAALGHSERKTFSSAELTAVENTPSPDILDAIPSPPGLENEQSVNTRSIVREVACLGLPALGGMLIDPVMSLVDTACVGQISSVQVAAMAPCTSIYQFVFQSCYFLSAATTNLVASRPLKGDNIDTEEAERRSRFHERVVSGASAMAVVLGSAIAALLIARSDGLLALAGCSNPTMLPMARQYLRIRALGLPPVLLATVLQGASLGRQDARTPLKIFVSAGIINLIGDVYLTLQKGWGVTGAAVATVAAQFSAAAYYAYQSFHQSAVKGDRTAAPGGVRLVWRGLPTRETVESFAGIASTMIMRSVALMAGYSLMTRDAASLGATALAAHQVSLQVFWMLSYLPDPMVVAAQSLVARDTAGAARHRLQKLVRVLYGMALATGITVAVATGFALTAPFITRSLVADTSVHALMAKIAPLAVVSQAVYPFVAVSDGVCVGAGTFRHLPVIMVVSTMGKIGALGYVTAKGFGVEGIWACLASWFMSRLSGHIILSKKARELLFSKRTDDTESITTAGAAYAN